MTQSIFDPGGDQTEHSGSTFLGPRAQDASQMPPDLIDGKVGEEEAHDREQLAHCDNCPGLPGLVAPFDDRDERENVEPPGTL